MKPIFTDQEMGIVKPVPCLVIISCTNNKQSGWQKAKDLYDSNYFTICKRWAERNCKDWWIASAKHCLLFKEDVVESYDQRFESMNKDQMKIWEEDVKQQMQRIRLWWPDLPIICLLSQRYYDLVKGERTYNIFQGLSGLSLGVAGRSKRLAEWPILTEEILQKIKDASSQS